jgi:hypothetical protein
MSRSQNRFGPAEIEVSKGQVATPTGPSGVRRWRCHFDDAAAIRRPSPARKGLAAADLPKFATGGVDMYLFDTVEV